MIRLFLAISFANSSLVSNFGRSRLGDFAAKCLACETGVKPLLPFVRSDRGANAFIWTLKRICWQFHIFDKNICYGTIELFRPEFLAVVRQVRPSPKSVCNLLFPDCFSNTDIWALFKWKNVQIPRRKTHRKKIEYPTKQEATLKVLQLSDVHIDLDYAENSHSECDQPLCCRATSTNSRKESGKTAFYWGTKASCDIPFRTFAATLDGAKETLAEPDFVLWTGDVPAHNLWEYSPRATSGLLLNVTSEIRSRFPNTPIFPSVGNHEGVPVNAFPANAYWLYETLARVWEPFGLEAQSYETIKKHGYYSQLIRPGFRVLSINSNFCNDENFWILLTDGDPGNQHQWLVDTLAKAESASEKVLLVGHIPPGEPDTITFCSSEFYKIIDRFSDIITSQFYGHTHWDQLKLFYDEQQEAINVAYVSPSVTTWEGVDPAFRIYEIDSWDRANSTFAVLDHHTFKTNIEETPRTAFPKFFKSYSAKSEYELIDLSPDSWAGLVSRWENNEDKRGFQKYFSNYYHKSQQNKCEGECRASFICEIQGIAFSLEIESAIDLTGETISNATSFISDFESLDVTSAAVTEIGNMLFRNSPRISSVVFTSSQIATLGDDLFEVLESIQLILTRLLSANNDDSVEFVALQSECTALTSGKKVHLISFVDASGLITGSVSRCDGEADDLTTSDVAVEMEQNDDSSCEFAASGDVVTISKTLGDNCGTTFSVDDNQYKLRNTLKLLDSSDGSSVLISQPIGIDILLQGVVSEDADAGLTITMYTDQTYSNVDSRVMKTTSIGQPIYFEIGVTLSMDDLYYYVDECAFGTIEKNFAFIRSNRCYSGIVDTLSTTDFLTRTTAPQLFQFNAFVFRSYSTVGLKLSCKVKLCLSTSTTQNCPDITDNSTADCDSGFSRP